MSTKRKHSKGRVVRISIYSYNNTDFYYITFKRVYKNGKPKRGHYMISKESKSIDMLELWFALTLDNWVKTFDLSVYPLMEFVRK